MKQVMLVHAASGRRYGPYDFDEDSVFRVIGGSIRMLYQAYKTANLNPHPGGNRCNVPVSALEYLGFTVEPREQPKTITQEQLKRVLENKLISYMGDTHKDHQLWLQEIWEKL